MELFLPSLLALVLVFLATIKYYYSKLYRIKTFLNQFPTPPSVPILGNALNFKSSKDFLTNLHKYTKRYGTDFYLKFGPSNHVFITSNYSFIELILGHSKLLSKTKNLKYLDPWIGSGLVLLEGDQWKTHRKLITPTFHFKILERFIDTFEQGGNVLVDKLNKIEGSESFDIYPYITQCALDIICETAMGIKIDSHKDKIKAYFNAVKDMCNIFIMRTTSVFLGYEFWFKRSKYFSIQSNAVKILHDFTNQVIKDKSDKLRNHQSTKMEEDEVGRKQKKVFLDLLLDARIDGKPLPYNEIRAEVDTFIFGGHDTTASASSFILYCLANNKDVQNKIVEEQRQLFGDDKFPTITYTNLQEMKYLENAIKEGLRLLPPVPAFGKQITEDVKWNDITIPSGLGVIIFVHGIHMNPKYFPNPEKYDPDRWNNIDGKLPYAFIPFSAGPRNCIGQKFAMLEMKSLIAKIVRNFQLLPAIPHHKLQLSAEAVLVSLNGVKIGIKSR